MIGRIITVFTRDLKRIFTNYIAAIVMIGVTLLPAAYAWFNIAANMDPYSNTSSIRIGVACEDTGASTSRTGDINVGDQLIDNLKENDALGWDFVRREEAVEGVQDGTYYAAIVIPENFSEDVLSFLDGEIGSPEIVYYVNEKKNAIAPKVTGTGASTIQTQINERFKEVVTMTLAELIKEKSLEVSDDLGKVQNNVNGKLSGVQRTLDGADSSLKKMKKTTRQARRLVNSTDKTVKAAETANNNAIKLTESNDKLISDIKEKIDKIEVISDLKIIAALYARATAANEAIKGVTSTLGAEISRIKGNIAGLPSVIDSTDKTIDATGKALRSVSGDIDDIKDSVNAVTDTTQNEILRIANNLDEEEIGDFFNSPIEVRARSYYPVDNYGSGMTPFYNMLAIWVGGIILIAIIKLVVDNEGMDEELKPSEAYLGRGLLFVFFGIFQALIICIGDIVLLKVQCEHPVLFCLAGVWASIVFVSTIYALATTFRHIGKALAVILVILQIPGSGGTFPVEMTGTFFRMIHPLLPFNYAINATRDAMAGLYGMTYAKNMAILLLFLVLALFTGLVIRMALLNVNTLFDHSLERTGLMATEHNSHEYHYSKLKAFAEVVTSDDHTARKLQRSRENFEKSYPLRARRGVLCLLIIPQFLMILMFVISRGKMFMLIGWIVALIGISTYLIVLEYIHHKNLQMMGGEDDA